MIKKIYQKFDSWMDYNPPGALSAKGWRLFDKEFRENAPIRYWLRNNFRDSVIYPIKRTTGRIQDFFSYNIFNRYHVVNTGLKPGYYGVDIRILNVNFNILKDFVECELGWSRHFYDEKDPWYTKLLIVRMYHRSTFRSPKHGLEYLDWASTLDDPNLPPYERCDHQAVAARETRELYDWWVNKRPARKTAKIPEYSDQGLDMWGCIDEDFDNNAPDYVQAKVVMAEQTNQESKWVEEDDEMLIRLIKIRQSLWT
jgi:hypothetical protein